MTIFTCGIPHRIAIRIMDVFLVKGEDSLFTLILRMMEKKEKHIKTLQGEELNNYLKGNMTVDCFEQFPLSELLTPFLPNQ